MYCISYATGNRELDRLLNSIPSVAEKPKAKPAPPVSKFTQRDTAGERTVLFDIFNHGVDMEDLLYFRKCYEKMLSKDDVVCVYNASGYFINGVVICEFPIYIIVNIVKLLEIDNILVSDEDIIGELNFLEATYP